MIFRPFSWNLLYGLGNNNLDNGRERPEKNNNNK
jgi:hypothetical protein